MAAGYSRTTDLPQVLAIFPLDGAILLPRGQLPLNVFEPRYLNMIDDAMTGDRIVGMVQTRGGPRDRPNLAAVGCTGRLTSYAETGDGRYLITLTGVCRFRIGAELNSPTPYRQIRADFSAFDEDLVEDETSLPTPPSLLSALRAYLARRALEVDWQAAETAPVEGLVNSLCMALPFEAAEKQALLEAQGFADRMAALTALLRIDAASDDGDPSPMQ